MGFFDNLIPNSDTLVVPLAEGQAKRLVDSTQNKMDRVALLIVLNSGIALDELLRLRSSDVNWKEGTITIYSKQIRNIKLPANVFSELREYLGDITQDRLIFPLEQRAFLKRMDAYKGICDFDWRRLRHTYAQLGFVKKIPPHIIAQNIGIPLPELLKSFNYSKPNENGTLPSVI